MNNFELPTFEKIKYLKNPVTDENCGVAIIINDKEQIQVTLNTENKYYAEKRKKNMPYVYAFFLGYPMKCAFYFS